MSIYSIIEQLRATSSKKEKEKILRDNIDNGTLKNFFRLALNQYINFYQKKPFKLPTISVQNTYTLDYAMEFLEVVIARRSITGNAAFNEIQNTLDNMDPDDAACIALILQKDPDCGVDTLAEKVWKGISPKYPCLLATAFTEELVKKHFDFTKKIYVQLKLDGLRVNIVVDDHGVVTVFTRSGRVMDVYGVFDHFSSYGMGLVYDGELLTVNSEGNFNNRQTSNGICSKAVKGTMSEAEASSLHVVLWDVIDLNDFNSGAGTTPYETRFDTLQTILVNDARASIVQSKLVTSLEEVNEFYSEKIAEGEEGAMLKCGNMIWEDSRSKKQLKLKAVNTCELRVSGAFEGKGALEGNLGSLQLKSDDGLVDVNMSGFNLKLRSEIWANIQNKPVQYSVKEGLYWTFKTANPKDTDINIGSIVEVTYNQKIKSRDSDTWSLFLPRYHSFRMDKTSTNTFEEII